MHSALEALPNDEAASVYQNFLRAREAAIIEEIRRACGIALVPVGVTEEMEPDEVAADVKSGTEPAEDELDSLELEFAQ